MCIIIVKKAGKIIDEDILENCFHNNGDGAGFCVVEKSEDGNDELNTYRGMFDFETFMKTWEPHQDKQALLHFRVATHKVIDAKNSHPFRLSDEVVMVHNGKITGLPYSEENSDTSVFCETVLKPLIQANPDFWLKEEFKWMIEQSIGTGNKIAIMSVKGDVRIFNESVGNWYDDCWFSNYSYRGHQTSFSQRNNPRSVYSPPANSNPTPKIDNVIDVKDVEVTPITKKSDNSDKKNDSSLAFEDLEEIEKKFTTKELEEIDERLAKYEREAYLTRK